MPRFNTFELPMPHDSWSPKAMITWMYERCVGRHTEVTTERRKHAQAGDAGLQINRWRAQCQIFLMMRTALHLAVQWWRPATPWMMQSVQWQWLQPLTSPLSATPGLGTLALTCTCAHTPWIYTWYSTTANRQLRYDRCQTCVVWLSRWEHRTSALVFSAAVSIDNRFVWQ